MISLPIKAVDGKTLQLWDRKNDKTYNINLTAGVVYCSDGKKVPDWRYLKAKMEEGVSVTVKLSSGTKSALVVWDEGPDLLSSMNSPFSGGASYYFPQMCK